jgi:PAS domain S-box-containing protein
LIIIDNSIKQIAFDNIWENSIVGLALIDSDGRFLNANPLFCSLVEYSLAELQDRTYQSITHPDDVKADVVMTGRVSIGEEKSFSMKKRYLTKTGKVVWVLLQVNPIINHDGSIVCLMSQVSELIDLIPPSITFSKPKESINLKFMDWVKKYWFFILFFIGSLAGVISEAFKRLG